MKITAAKDQQEVNEANSVTSLRYAGVIRSLQILLTTPHSIMNTIGGTYVFG